MERSISRKMSRKEVIASMANKLADGSVEGTKKKFHRKILIINLSVISLFGTMVFFVSTSISKKSSQQELHNDFLQTASVTQSPLEKLKSAFQDGAIGADEYALYMTYLLVRYDSVPQNFKTPRPMINSEELYAELNKVWGRVSLRMRQRISEELLPQFRSRAQ